MSSEKLAGHAHPTSVHSKSQSVADIYADLGISLRLKNLPGSERYTAVDLYCPEVRRTPITPSSSSHIDVVTTWKGLTLARAVELFFWEETFQDCLEEYIEEVMICMFEEHLRQRNDYVTQWTMVPMLSDFLSAESRRLIDIAVPDLVSDMIQKFYAGGHNTTHPWFTSTRNLPGMVYNFIRTRDCFVDSYPYPSMEIGFSYDLDFSYDRKGPAMVILGDVKWFPPVIDFSNVPSALPIGAEYRIAGTYIEPVLTESFDPFPTEAEYVVESEKLPLAWDSNHRCFRAIVPDISPSSGRPQENIPEVTPPTPSQRDRETVARTSGRETIGKLETKFTANILLEFPDNVRFETASRYKLYLEVLKKASSSRVPAPLLRPTRLHYVPGPLSDDSFSGETASIHLTPPEELGSRNHVEATIGDTAHDYPTPPSPYRYGLTGTPQMLPFHSVNLGEGRPRHVSPKRKQPTNLLTQNTSSQVYVGGLDPTERPGSGGELSPKRQRRMERVDSCNGGSDDDLVAPEVGKDYVPRRMPEELPPMDILIRSRRSQAPSPPTGQGVDDTRGSRDYCEMVGHSVCGVNRGQGITIPEVQPATSTTKRISAPKCCYNSHTPFVATSEVQPATSSTHLASVPIRLSNSPNNPLATTSIEEVGRSYVWSSVPQQADRRVSPAEQQMREYRSNHEEFMGQKREQEQRLRLPVNSRLDGARDEEEDITNAFMDGSGSSSPLSSSGEEYESHSDTTDPMKESTILCYREEEA